MYAAIFLLFQGFHVLFDSHNSFGGAASKALAYLKDEFPGKSVLTFPVTPTVLPDQVKIVFWLAVLCKFCFVHFIVFHQRELFIQSALEMTITSLKVMVV